MWAIRSGPVRVEGRRHVRRSRSLPKGGAHDLLDDVLLPRDERDEERHDGDHRRGQEQIPLPAGAAHPGGTWRAAPASSGRRWCLWRQVAKRAFKWSEELDGPERDQRDQEIPGVREYHRGYEDCEEEAAPSQLGVHECLAGPGGGDELGGDDSGGHDERVQHEMADGFGGPCLQVVAPPGVGRDGSGSGGLGRARSRRSTVRRSAFWRERLDAPTHMRPPNPSSASPFGRRPVERRRTSPDRRHGTSGSQTRRPPVPEPGSGGSRPRRQGAGAYRFLTEFPSPAPGNGRVGPRDRDHHIPANLRPRV